MEWSNASKCLLASMLCLGAALMYLAGSMYYFAHPELADYVDRDTALAAYRFQVYGIVGGWALLTAASLVCCWLVPDSGVLVWAVVLHYAIGFGVSSHLFGHYTSLFTGLVAVTGVTCGFALFDRTRILVGVAVFSAIVFGTTAAEQLGMIRYAPLFTQAPFRDGHLSGWWLGTFGSSTLVLMLFVTGLIDFIIRRWHESGRRLLALSEELRRANATISRYVAPQLAQRIREGNHEADAQPSRRRLTIVFSDIVDFSAAADEIEPEDLAELLNGYLTEMTRIAGAYGGTIDKFIGDAVLVFFGAPQATDDRDHALRAVHMAIEMQRKVTDLDLLWRRHGVRRPLRIRIGVNTGQVSVGSFGSTERMEYTAIGRQVNLAARLETACEPGRILVSSSTRELIGDAIACVAKGEIQVKGIRNPVAVYSVVTAAGSAGDPDREVG